MRMILPANLSKLLPFLKKGGGALNLTDGIWIGFVALVILFLAIALWGGYFFYSRVVIKPESGNEVITRRPTARLDVKDIDEIIGILDERQKKFDEILGTK